MSFTFEIWNDEPDEEGGACNDPVFAKEFQTLKQARAFAQKKIREDRELFSRKFEEQKTLGVIPFDAEFDDEIDGEGNGVDYWPRSYFITGPGNDPDDPDDIETYDIWIDD